MKIFMSYYLLINYYGSIKFVIFIHLILNFSFIPIQIHIDLFIYHLKFRNTNYIHLN
jgi:hypothetical protein